MGGGGWRLGGQGVGAEWLVVEVEGRGVGRHPKPKPLNPYHRAAIRYPCGVLRRSNMLLPQPSTIHPPPHHTPNPKPVATGDLWRPEKNQYAVEDLRCGG